MKSSSEKLKGRGYINNLDLSEYSIFTTEELYHLADSKLAFERTIAFHLLAQKININEKRFVALLLSKLKREKELYTKIEICSILEKGNKDTCRMITEYLGKIGDNQHQEIPETVSKKNSFPLPRDIIARILGRMNPENIEVLLEILKSGDVFQISEDLDAIGFMVFYNRSLETYDNFVCIKEAIEAHKHIPLIVWKGVLCLSAFRLEETRKYLLDLQKDVLNYTIMQEIDRTLGMIR